MRVHLETDRRQETRILVVDDHALFREGISRFLQTEPGFRVVGTCGSLENGLELIAATGVDIVLLDDDLNGEDGTLFFEAAKAKGFKGHILMVTAGMPSTRMLRAFERGASGIVLKHSSPQELIESIHAIASGQVWLDSRAVKALIDGANRKAQAGQLETFLNARELVVVRAVLAGQSNKEIAAKLELSEGAIKALLQKLYAKAGVRTRSQLVRVALQNHADDWLSSS